MTPSIRFVNRPKSRLASRDEIICISLSEGSRFATSSALFSTMDPDDVMSRISGKSSGLSVTMNMVPLSAYSLSRMFQPKRPQHVKMLHTVAEAYKRMQLTGGVLDDLRFWNKAFLIKDIPSLEQVSRVRASDQVDQSEAKRSAQEKATPDITALGRCRSRLATHCAVARGEELAQTKLVARCLIPGCG